MEHLPAELTVVINRVQGHLTVGTGCWRKVASARTWRAWD